MLLILIGNSADSYAQLLTVLVIFVVVLFGATYATKWIAGYQKKSGMAGNIELLDATRLTNNKYIQIVRLGETYYALAICKDTVTVIGEIPGEELKISKQSPPGASFQEILSELKNRKETKDGEAPKDGEEKD